MIIILKDGQKFKGTPQLNPDKVAQLVRDGIWTEEDLAREGLESAEPFTVPEGKIVVGEPTYEKDKDGHWIEVRQVEDIPEPEPDTRTDTEKLEAATDLTIEQIRAVLGLK